MRVDFERRRQGAPIVIDRLDDLGEARALMRVALTSGSEGNPYDEGWVQRLIHLFPQSLPITDIEPRFDDVIPICMELPTEAGYVDNLFVTADGDLVLAECKLWRNPQARREVVAQAIDYAHSLSGWSYQQFEAAISKARLPNGKAPGGSLFEIVTRGQGGDEIGFIDAVSRNLRLGRILLLIVGDGIREGVETLTDYLQDHAGSHFTLGLVEMAVYGLPKPRDGYLVMPCVLSKTVLIERGVVRIAVDGRITVAPPSLTNRAVTDGAFRRNSISREEFFETLGRLSPDLPERLQHFLDRMVETMDAGYGFGRGIKLSVRTSSGDATLGHIYADAASGNFKGTAAGDAVFTPYTARKGRDIGIPDADMEYFRDLAAIIGGKVLNTRADGKPLKDVTVGETGKRDIRLATVLDKEDEVLRAFASYRERLDAKAG